MMDERENINIFEPCDESSKQSPRDVSGTGLIHCSQHDYMRNVTEWL